MSKNCMQSGTLRYNPTNPRYFADGRGEAVYLTGSHTWATMSDIWLENGERKDFDYDGFIRMLSDHGHNFLRFWQWMGTRAASWDKDSVRTLFDPQPYERTGPGMAKDGKPKFDLTRWNEDYFSRLRSRVQQAGEKEIYVSVMLFDAWNVKFAKPGEEDIWTFHPMNKDNNSNAVQSDPTSPRGDRWGLFSLEYPELLELQKKYVQKVVETLNDFDHVLYEICNEEPYTREAMAWQQTICLYIKELEQSLPKQHPVGITAEGSIHDNEELFRSPADWISPGDGRGFEYRYNPPPADGRKVVLSDTDHLWGHGCELQWIWKSFTRGLNVLFMDPWEPIPGDPEEWLHSGMNQRYYHAWDPMRRNLGYTRKVAARFDMNHMVPDTKFCTSGYCLAQRDQAYVCYYPAGGYEGLDCTGLSGEFTVEWLNPATGMTALGSPFTTQIDDSIPYIQRASLRAPFDGPAVLLFYKKRS